MIKNTVDNPKLKAETFKARFLEAGVVQYADEMVLIRPENLMTIALKFKGAKTIIDHKEVNESNANEIVGYINNIWKGEDGWAWCDFTVNNQEAIDLINKGYSVSCAYLPVATGSGGTKNNVPYDREIIDIVDDDEVTHLAIVENPRYEDAIILKNSIKNKMTNIFKFISKKETAKENSVKELDLDSAAFDIDGDNVPVSSLMAAYKNQKDEDEKKERENEVDKEKEKEAKINADSEFEVDGKMVKVSEMAKAFKAAKKNQEDEEKKNAEDEKEKEEEKEEKKKEAKKNSIDAEAIATKRKAFENGLENSLSEIEIITDDDRFAAGKALYGSSQSVTK